MFLCFVYFFFLCVFLYLMLRFFYVYFFFFFKQKTAYEMRISDWSSDVCSSDLYPGGCRSSSACHGKCRWQKSGTAPESNTDPARSRGSASNPTATPHRPPPRSPATGCCAGSGYSSRQIGRASCRERVCQYV